MNKFWRKGLLGNLLSSLITDIDPAVLSAINHSIHHSIPGKLARESKVSMETKGTAAGNLFLFKVA